MPVLMFLMLLILSFVVAYFLLRPTKSETAVQQHLENIKGSRSDEEVLTILKEEGYSTNPEIAQLVRQIPGALGTLNLIRQAGQKFSVALVMGVALLATVVVAGIVSLLVSDIVLPILCGLAAGFIPYLYLLIMREVRFRQCDKLLPEAIDLMARALRAGHALTATLEMVGQEIGEPVGSEFRRLHEEHALGLPLREATLNLVSRLPRDDMRFLATAMLLQKETGGNLAVILDKTSVIARERARLRGQLNIYTAQGRITGWILCFLPFIMFGLLSLLNWDFEKLLFTEHMGRVLVYIGLGLMGLGVLAIRKIIDVKV